MPSIFGPLVGSSFCRIRDGVCSERVISLFRAKDFQLFVWWSVGSSFVRAAIQTSACEGPTLRYLEVCRHQGQHRRCDAGYLVEHLIRFGTLVGCNFCRIRDGVSRERVLSLVRAEGLHSFFVKRHADKSWFTKPANLRKARSCHKFTYVCFRRVVRG